MVGFYQYLTPSIAESKRVWLDLFNFICSYRKLFVFVQIPNAIKSIKTLSNHSKQKSCPFNLGKLVSKCAYNYPIYWFLYIIPLCSFSGPHQDPSSTSNIKKNQIKQIKCFFGFFYGGIEKADGGMGEFFQDLLKKFFPRAGSQG